MDAAVEMSGMLEANNYNSMTYSAIFWGLLMIMFPPKTGLPG